MLWHDNKQKIDYWAGRHVCPRCKKTTDFHLVHTLKKYLLFLFIPVMTLIDDRFLKCDECGYEKKLTIRTYNKIKKYRKKSLKNFQYPKEMIKKDFAPVNLSYDDRIFRLILSVLLVFFAIYSFISTVRFDERNIISFVVIGVHACIPLALSLKGLIPFLSKSKIYKKRKKYPSYDNDNGCIDYKILDGDKLLYEPSYEKIYEKMDNRDNIFDVEGNTIVIKKESFIKSFIYSLFCAFNVIPKSMKNDRNFKIAFNKLSGSKTTIFFLLSLISFLLAIVTFVVQYVAGLSGENYLFPVMGFIMMFVVFFIILIVSGIGISSSLKTLVVTGNIRYMGEILSYIGLPGDNVIFEKHLLYDKRERVIVAYEDIVSTYLSNDDNHHYPFSVLCTKDGKRHKANIYGELLYEFKKRTPWIS